MIAIDWGTSSARAYRLDPAGAIRESRETGSGILHVPPMTFAAALRALVGDWIDAGERRVLLSGMVGSRQGWREVAYRPCPAGIDDLRAGLETVPFEPGVTVRIVPGLSAADEAGIPEVMRGEEVQVFGALAGRREGLLCLPGSHSKWVRVRDGRICGFTTGLTGEAYAALRGHTILGRMMEGEPVPGEAFDAGVRRAQDAGGLLHHLFGTRALGLFGRLSPAEGASYLSGLLIGHDVRENLPPGGGTVDLIGAGPLMTLYARAIAARGGAARSGDADAAARGLALIGEGLAWA
ncbi:2-dehydro-3-deoxygalactonokinase [Methylobacterium nodulans]|uniref:2-keto-3-deoxy-galactonokinase n=1 Tax=Methylobacterium nodulans (strain LMG 21967 / CNCM I-2342 / ORS 2060) TaxID=460265 RepID=B8IFV6_METNO|nr:2-dehydro-3-deoxygalactonokinase [Methylobacterium nodulans]ACL59666.1 2-keto-3-deoxy-galactonokinase [Methylobacterium nodulans ORS 2060]